MLSVYGDESADETKHRVFAVAGLIGDEARWEGLENAWKTRIGGTPFHANDCDSDHGDYEATSHLENKCLYKDLSILLAESGVGGWAFAIDLIAQRNVFPDAPDISYYKGFMEVLDAMRNCAINNRETIKFTFDMRVESDHNAGMIYGMFREMPEWKDVTFSNIAFESSRDNRRIQAADLFAREAMKHLDNMVGPVTREARKSWLALSDTGRFHIVAVGEGWFEDLKRQMPTLEEETGTSRIFYQAWLLNNKLHHNATNMFRYVYQKAKDDREKRSGQI
jgi:hypothetical protein